MFRGRDHDQLKEFTLLTNIRTPENYVSFVRMLLFGQRPRRGRWPMLSHIWETFSFSSFSFFSFFFSVPPPLEAQILVSRPKSYSWGLNPSLETQIQASLPKSQIEAQIPASRPKSQPQGSNPSLKAQIPASRPISYTSRHKSKA